MPGEEVPTFDQRVSMGVQLASNITQSRLGSYSLTPDSQKIINSLVSGVTFRTLSVTPTAAQEIMDIVTRDTLAVLANS